MKLTVFFIAYIVLQTLQLDTTNLSALKETVFVPSKVETVKVFINEKNYTPISEDQNQSMNFFDELTSQIISVGWKIFLALLIVFILGFLSYKLNQFYNKYNLSSKFKNAVIIKVILHIIIWLLALLIIAFALLKTSTLLILFILALIFIVFIISISDLTKNIVGGIIILIDKPFEYGDWIKIGEYSGRIHSKNLRNTNIITDDDSLIKIPNHLFVITPFENLNIISKNKQITFVVEIPPKSEISKLKSAVYEIVSLSVYNSINKPVEVIFKGVNIKGNLEFQIWAYVFDAKYESEMKSDVQEKIAEHFGAI